MRPTRGPSRRVWSEGPRVTPGYARRPSALFWLGLVTVGALLGWGVVALLAWLFSFAG